MSTKHEAYTLWVKFRNTGWVALITTKKTELEFLSPYSFLDHYANRLYSDSGYHQRGKTWMIKPEGEKPAELLAKG